MNHKEYKAEAYYSVSLCDCGGEFRVRIGKVDIMHDPIQADFECGVCHKIETLDEKNFPGIKYKVIYDN